MNENFRKLDVACYPGFEVKSLIDIDPSIGRRFQNDNFGGWNREYIFSIDFNAIRLIYPQE